MAGRPEPSRVANAREVCRHLKALGKPGRAKASEWFFKTGPGGYGEGDRFYGVDAAAMHAAARRFRSLPLEQIEKLLASPWHEARMVALLVLARQYADAGPRERRRFLSFYLLHTDRINNWDLVDASAPPIVGAHVAEGGRSPLPRLARSRSVWERRIAIVATLAPIRAGDLRATFDIARRLLDDRHDLIHKAAGWMLREAGKRDPSALRAFLRASSGRMPRTMLRYAIERFPESERRSWLSRPIS